MASSTTMNAVCIGCRLRRKKCDRKRPICTSCLELNISDDLCIYPKTKLQLASKDSKITLDMLRNKNKDLKKEYELLQSLSPGQIEKMTLTQSYQQQQQQQQQHGHHIYQQNHHHHNHHHSHNHHAQNLPYPHVQNQQQPHVHQQYLTANYPNTLTHNDSLSSYDQPQQQQVKKKGPPEHLKESQFPTLANKQNPLLTTMKNHGNIHMHCGSLSWEALFFAEKDSYLLCAQFDELLEMIKTRHDKLSEDFAEEMDTDSRFQQLKQLLLSMLIGKEPLSSVYSTMHELLEIIANRLPPYDMVMTLVDRFFIMTRIQQNVMLEVNEDAIYETIGHCFTKGPNGHVQINVRFPEEWVKIPGIALVLGIVAQMLFQVNRLLNPITSANHLLILDSIQLLLVAFSIFRRFDIKYRDIMIPEVAIQFLQGFIFYSGFDTYNPQGREHERSDKTGENLVLVWRMITYARAAYLNKDIDQVYHHKTKEYRRSLKSIWFWLAFLDVSESIEFGAPTKIKREELLYYPDHSNEFTRSIALLNESVADFKNFENIDDPHIFIEKIENILIPKSNQTLQQFPNRVSDDLRTLHEMDFNNLSLVHKFMSTVQTFSIRLTTYALIHSYYYHCYKRLELAGIDGDLKRRYNILSMKYAILVFELIPAIFSAYRRLWGHEHSSTFGSLGTIISIFPAMKLAFRRVTVFVGARIFDMMPTNKSTAILKLFELGNESDREILDFLLKRDNPTFFQLSDLEDPVIDSNSDLLIRKFAPLLNHRFVMLTCARTMCDLVDYLQNSTYNLNFVSLNRAFFLAIKIVSFYVRVYYKNVTTPQAIKDAEEEAQKKYENGEAEINLQLLYDRALTSKGSFDIEGFFKPPNDAK